VRLARILLPVEAYHAVKVAACDAEVHRVKRQYRFAHSQTRGQMFERQCLGTKDRLRRQMHVGIDRCPTISPEREGRQRARTGTRVTLRDRATSEFRPLRRRHGYRASHRSEISQIERFERPIALQQGACSAAGDEQRSGNVTLPDPAGKFLVTPPIQRVTAKSIRLIFSRQLPGN
jgi:hypothetical protein